MEVNYEIYKFYDLIAGYIFYRISTGGYCQKNHVPGRPFAHLKEQIDNQEKIDNIELIPGPQGPPGPIGPQGLTGPEGPQGSTGVLDKYMKVNEVILFETGSNFIVYCDNIPDDVAISGNAYTYWTDTPGGFQYSSYKDILRPVCTYYGEGGPGPAANAMTCQQGELPIGWQFIQHPANDRQNDKVHVVVNVMCIYASNTQ